MGYVDIDLAGASAVLVTGAVALILLRVVASHARHHVVEKTRRILGSVR